MNNQKSNITNIIKNQYGHIEEDQCLQIVADITGGTVAKNMREIPEWMIDDELARVRPVGTTILVAEFGVELIRLPNGGYHIYHPSRETDDGISLGHSTSYVDLNYAFIWAMHNGLVASINDFTRAVDRAMCHNHAKLLSQSNGLMAHKMDTQPEVFKIRVRELLDLKAFRKCVMLIDDEIEIVEITESMAATIEQLCLPEGEDYGYPRYDKVGFPKLNSLREDLKEAPIGELVSNSETCYFATNCASSKWDFPAKLQQAQLDSAVWCLPIQPVKNIDISELAIGAVTLCVLAEAWLTAIEWPAWGLDRATLSGRQTEQQQCAVSPHSPNIFSMEDIWDEHQ